MFSLILPSRPPLPPPAPSGPQNNQFAFSFPSQPHFSHIVVFLLPGNDFPPNTAAGVHVQLPGQDSFRFLGALGEGKVSAIFKVNLPDTTTNPAGSGECRVGISVEPVESIRGQLEALEAEKAQTQSGAGPGGKPSTKVLAQRIIQNAFNFLASFSGTLGPGGQEVVPLKSFEEWWKKFERRVEVDPGFLEREQNLG
jgi:protein Hikeshi